MITLIDYDSSTSKDLSSGESNEINFPKSNVLQFITADGSKISVRPSGTEPKIKFYFSVNKKISSMNEYFEGVNELSLKINRLTEELENF